ncbi:9257_t:CDS:10 [Funneliformis mosseae]|uniref:9257_t:CDS:1 n=1 Tax=Funneliformis mosseae TaxID=27381 RepID=A0A9N9DEA1_FUNMO|nr:9257_t:CDS:10 [Funneliformis mosseae]
MNRTKQSKSTSDSTQKCRKKLHQEAQKQSVIYEKNETRQFRTLAKHMNSMLKDRTDHDRKMFRQLHDAEYHLNESAKSPPSVPSIDPVKYDEERKLDEIDDFFQSPPEKLQKSGINEEDLSGTENDQAESEFTGESESEDEEENTPPRIDKKAFREKYKSIPESSKMRLSTGKIVENTLFKFCKNMDYEHHAHSYIVDCDDTEIKALFTDTEWNELTNDRLGVPPIPADIAKELSKYGKKTLEEFREVSMTSYLQNNVKYNVHQHYDNEWIQMSVRNLVNLYENTDCPLLQNQYEDWYTVALFGSCIDLCLRDMRLGTDIKRTDAPSLASANRKNRTSSTRKRKLTGRKIDGIVYVIYKLLEIGAIEAARSFKGVSDRKYLLENFKMPKTLRDMLADMIRDVNYEEERVNKLQSVRNLTPRIKGSSYQFSVEGVKNFLRFLAMIYQYKIIVKDNLNIIKINANSETEDDLYNEFMGIGQSSRSTPPPSIYFFADSEKTPKKAKKNSVKKRN